MPRIIPNVRIHATPTGPQGAPGGAQGPASSTEDNIVTFYNSAGDQLKDSGIPISDVTSIKTVVNPASSSAPASLDLAEQTTNGTNKITITAPSAIASDKTLTLPDETGTLLSTANIAIVDLLRADGWVSGDAMTYASATTFTVAGDQTAKYTKGTKIKVTNASTTKYFYVVSSSFSSVTTVTVTGEVDLANSAITSPFYSYVDTPQGFPNGRDKYKCSVGVGNQLNIEQNVDTRIRYNSEVFDVGNNFDAVTNNVFFAPISGYYLITASVLWQNITVGENLTLNIKVNGVARYAKVLNIAQSTYGQDIVVSGLVYCNNNGGYVEVTTNHDGSGATQDVTSGTFSAFFVSI